MSTAIQYEDNSAYVHTETQVENEERENFTTESDLVVPVYSEKTVITVQPHGSEGDRGERYPLPMSTVSNWRGNFLPLTGLQFLVGVEQISIQQTVELSDLLSNIESENRYVVKSAGGETLFVGSETSSAFQRFCCGSGRSFEIHLFDPTQQEAFILKRRLACNVGILSCYLQKLDVFTPQGDLLGSIVQEWTLLIPRFIIKDDRQNIIFYMEGPKVCSCSMFKEATFQVLSENTRVQVASISHSWENMAVSYNLRLTFPSHHVENSQKALMIGAAFLLVRVIKSTKTLRKITSFINKFVKN